VVAWNILAVNSTVQTGIADFIDSFSNQFHVHARPFDPFVDCLGKLLPLELFLLGADEEDVGDAAVGEVLFDFGECVRLGHFVVVKVVFHSSVGFVAHHDAADIVLAQLGEQLAVLLAEALGRDDDDEVEVAQAETLDVCGLGKPFGSDAGQVLEAHSRAAGQRLAVRLHRAFVTHARGLDHADLRTRRAPQTQEVVDQR